MASWKSEVIADDSGKWVSNALRFPTKPEAEAYARDLASRWTLVRETRVIECDEGANYEWVEGSARRIGG